MVYLHRIHDRIERKRKLLLEQQLRIERSEKRVKKINFLKTFF